MAVWDRDYARSDGNEGVFDASGFRAPDFGAKLLLIIHGIAAVFVLGADMQIVDWPVQSIRLSGENQQALGILLHPVSGPLLSVIFSGLVIWMLGGAIERNFGTEELLKQYLLGNLVAGGLFWIIITLQPNPEAAPLEIPAGAAAAWCFTAWQRMQVEQRQLFNRDITVGNLIGIAAIIFILTRLLFFGSNGVPMILAALGASMTSLVSESLPVIRFKLRESKERNARHRPAKRSSTPKPKPGPDIDAILAKISREGIEALTDGEHDQLEEARRAKIDAEKNSE